MKRNLFRSRDSHGGERVGFIETFFDLVFAFAVIVATATLVLVAPWELLSLRETRGALRF